SERVLRVARQVVHLLEATASRPPSFGCFGMHEWAMVHRQDQDDVRHASWPLRLGSDGTSAVVDAAPVRCTHFDAFRFFTPTARPLNAVQLTRDTQLAHEQPGCLHAGMDLYGWAYRLSPQVPSELVADAFDLARRIRVLDMRASPYDLSALGHEPVRVETPEGRAEYAAAQRAFASEGAVLRARVLDAARALLPQDG
ncbi:MAG: 3-methyladenine glycosylase, partial [Frankiales bacterium]|nr:3-methyladenine glycosylase [Frankiales bacterium]